LACMSREVTNAKFLMFIRWLTVLARLYGRRHCQQSNDDLLWPPCVIGQAIIFSFCGFFFFMAALHSRCGHYILALWFLLLSISFPYLFSAVACWMSTILHTWCGLSANLGSWSEMCCMRLTENTGPKKLPKIRHLGTIAQLYQAVSSQRRHVSTIGKKSC